MTKDVQHSQNWIRTCLALGALFALALLSGCGGGGSGATENSSTNLAPCLEYKTPTSPNLMYEGKTTAATLDENSAQPLVADLFQMVNGIAFMPSYNNDEVVQEDTCIATGDNQGTDQTEFFEYYRPDGAGWEAAQYKNYPFIIQHAQLTGLAYAMFAVDSNGIVQETMWLEQLRVVTDAGDDFTFDGTLTFPLQKGSNTYTWISPLLANFIATNNKTGTQVWINNVTVKYSDQIGPDFSGGDTTHQTITGRVYDSLWGYADTSTPEDLISNNFMSNGRVKFSNSGQSALYAKQLNFLKFAYELDLDGDGEIDESARGSWSTLSYDLTPWPSLTGPVPIAVINSIPQVGARADFDSLGSYSPSGNFITSSWKLLYAPPGSAATLSTVQTPTPAFIPDVPGDYRIQLTVSDGLHSNAQNFVMSVTGSTGRDERQLQGNNPIIAAIGPNQEVHVGETVMVDGTASRDKLNAHWYLISPPGSHAVLAPVDAIDLQTLRESFVPDLPGYYIAVYGDTYEIVAVDTGLNFDTPIAVNYGAAAKAVAFAVGDFNHDGYMDVATLTGSTSSAHIQIYYGNVGGKFSSPVTLSDPPVAGGLNLLAKDVNNDGLTDLIVVTSTGAPFIYFQNSNGTFSAPESVATTSGSSCVQSGNVYFLAAGTWDGQPGNSLFTYDTCVFGSSNMDVLASSGGQFSLSSSYSLSLPSYLGENVTATDLTGSGLGDLIVGNPYLYTSTKAAITIYAGQTNGSFNQLASYSLNNFANGAQFYTVGDLDNDGKLDVAALDGNDVDVFPNNGSAGLSTAVQYGLPGVTGLFYPISIGTSDINSDGRNDLILGYIEPDYISTALPSPTFIGFMLQTQAGTFASELRFPVGVDTLYESTGGPGASVIVPADMNKDGMMDVVMLVGGTVEILQQKN